MGEGPSPDPVRLTMEIAMTDTDHTPKFVPGTRLSGIIRLLVRWKGSIFKLIGLDVVIWLLFFYTFSCIYRFLLDDDQRTLFEKAVLYCRDFNSNIPLTFVLGFYVTTVINRWWGLWNTLPWPDDVIHYLTTYLNGQDERSKLMRRTILRYVNLGTICCMRYFSSRVKKRFPSMRSLVEAGLMEESERRMMEVMGGDSSDSLRSMFWIPHTWATRIAHQAREENRIQSDLGLRGIVDAVTAVRRTCAMCQHVEFIEVPVVYSQVVTIATYSFYCALVLGSQSIDGDDSDKDDINAYAPITSVFLLVLYVGWLKVAESLIDPYGEDDADFELNWLFDRHIKVTHVLGEGMNTSFKEYTWKDMFPWLYDQTLAPKAKLLLFANMMDKDKDNKVPELVDVPIPRSDPDTLRMTTLFRILRMNDAPGDGLQSRRRFKFEDQLSLIEKEWEEL
ncbi:unnamed protein product [Darwinula stevensoni]|uniref:Bestrophin homolog n=1 Tax=Darwinula stevensoni TaxID=69355 RepID=A0A7R8XDR4_9CRUS|nr:unnamed protein product [Darwinula stevensoni]CAG0895052.1 unnamed protein product [Darwinula stevensoni]